MPATYDPIATTTLGTAGRNITFSSISGTYTDLRLVFAGSTDTTGGLRIRLNSIFADPYSLIEIYGDGTGIYHNTTVGDSGWNITGVYGSQLFLNKPALITMDLFSYAGSKFKTALFSQSLDRSGAGTVVNNVGLLQTTAAITSINLFNTGGNFNVGSTATLYGIKAA